MLLAHLVPGYFALTKSEPQWKPKWNDAQRMVLVAAAYGSTVVPDLDVIYNALFRGFINHSTLWTHSLFVHLGVGALWLVLRQVKRWPYLTTLFGLIAFGGLSHLVLDVASHGTPLFYPLSSQLVGIASARVIEGGFWAYITDPIFLFEPALQAFVIAHWVLHQPTSTTARNTLLLAVVCVWALFSILFLLALPTMQALVPVS